jgi:hypothetical protein
MTDVRERLDRPRLVRSPPRTYRGEKTFDGVRETPSRRGHASTHCSLTGTIETSIIPRLVMAHSKAPERHSNLALQENDAAANDAAALAEKMLSGDTEGAILAVDFLRARGHALHSIYLQLLAPAAVHLRQLWSNDLCGFAEATLALWRLQQLLRHYSVEFRAEGEHHETGSRALLSPTPREKHDLSFAMFYLVLISEFFRRDGWEAWIEPDPTTRDFAQVIREQWFDVVEFLVSGDKQLDVLASRIRMIRRESPNRSIGVMVYGQVFIEHPELVLLVGADLATMDASEGALQSQRLVGLPARP